jgi:hypothetical protein
MSNEEIIDLIDKQTDRYNRGGQEWKDANIAQGLSPVPPIELARPFFEESRRHYDELEPIFRTIERQSNERIHFKWRSDNIEERRKYPDWILVIRASNGGSRMRPHIPKNKQGASTFVLACIDPRFTKYLADFLIHDKEIANDYDLFALAGAELGANQTKHKCWKTTLTQPIDVALDLHNIKQLLVFSHMDCGAYKVFKDLEKDDNHKLHEKELKKLHKFIGKKYPQLIYKGFIMDTDGSIHKVKC